MVLTYKDGDFLKIESVRSSIKEITNKIARSHNGEYAKKVEQLLPNILESDLQTELLGRMLVHRYLILMQNHLLKSKSDSQQLEMCRERLMRSDRLVSKKWTEVEEEDLSAAGDIVSLVRDSINNETIWIDSLSSKLEALLLDLENKGSKIGSQRK